MEYTLEITWVAVRIARMLTHKVQSYGPSALFCRIYVLLWLRLLWDCLDWGFIGFHKQLWCKHGKTEQKQNKNQNTRMFLWGRESCPSERQEGGKTTYLPPWPGWALPAAPPSVWDWERPGLKQHALPLTSWVPLCFVPWFLQPISSGCWEDFTSL